jgi:hypothetical protein
VLLGRKNRGNKKMKKLFMIFMVLLTLAVPMVSAESADYDIKAVYVNTIKATEDNKIQVELDTTLQVQVEIQGTGATQDARIRAWIGGYEYGTLETTTDVIKVEDGVTSKHTMYIEIPEDLDVQDHDYTLHVNLFDSQSQEREDYDLYFENERNRVIIEDILLSTDTVAPGEYIGVKVRLENQGDRTEENLKVTVSMEDFGISQRMYLDQLEMNKQDETSTVFLTIPAETLDGTYVVSVNVEYNNGFSETQDFELLRVDGDAVTYDENAVVSMSAITDLQVGKESTFKAQITNFEENSRYFYLDVQGMEADFDQSVLIAGGSTADMYFTLNPTQESVENILVSISSDEGIVEEKQYTIEVEEKQSALPTLLAIVFAVLVVIGIVLYINKR